MIIRDVDYLFFYCFIIYIFYKKNDFLCLEEAEEAINIDDEQSSEKPKPPMGEICLLSSPSIVVSLEMDIGNETIPVLVMQASLTAQVKDWSSEVSSILLGLEIIFFITV